MTINMPIWLAVVMGMAFLGSGIQLGIWLVRFARWAWSTIEEPKWWRVLLACISAFVGMGAVAHWVYGKSEPWFMFTWGFNAALLIIGLGQLLPKEAKMCGRPCFTDGCPCVKDVGHKGDHENRNGQAWRDEV